MSLGFSNRCLVLVTDYGVNVYEAGKSKIKYIQHLSWSQPNFSESLAEVIAKDAHGNSVIILNDMVEQHFRKERLPDVPFFDRKNVLQRKLNITFPTYPIRAAKVIKEPKSLSSKEKSSGQLYLFCALPASDALSKVIEGIRLSLASLSGLGLLPVESVSMIKMLSQKLRKQKNIASEAGWKIFVSQHSSGGLRQIVSKGDDELALTRMTPVSDPNADPGQWAVEVLQEVKSTINYLSRFGFKPSDGLEIIFVAPKKNQTVFADIIDVSCNLFSLTLPEAASMLGVKIAKDTDERWADILHSGWAAKKTSLSLSLPSRDLAAISHPRQTATIVRNILLVGCLGALGYGVYEADGYFKSYAKLVEAREMKIKLQVELDEEVRRKESLGIDIKLVQAALSAEKGLETQGFNPIPLLLKISQVMPKDMRVDELSMEYVPPQADPDVPPGGTGIPVDVLAPVNGTFRTYLTFKFPVSLKPEIGNRKMLDLQMALQKELVGKYVVSVSKKVADLSFSGAFKMELEVGKTVAGVEDASAVLQIDSLPLTPDGDPNAAATGNN